MCSETHANESEGTESPVTECLSGESFFEWKTYWKGIDIVDPKTGIANPKKIVDWSENYVVFMNSADELDWDTSPEHEKATRAKSDDLAKQNEILAEAAILEARVRRVDAIGKDATEWFRYFIGRALVSTFERDYSGAQRILSKAGQYFRARSEETSRRWYLLGSYAFALPFVVLGTLVWAVRIRFIDTLSATFFWFLLGMVAGALGALLSVIARSWRLQFDASAGWFLHYLEAASRITMGALSGSLVGLAMKSDLFFGGLIPSGATVSAKNGLIILAAFAAGASERLLGSIISKFDPNARSDQNGGAPQDAGAKSDNDPPRAPPSMTSV